jgi:competence protein ComEC
VLIVAEPEQVPGVSFQMSFSAVLALIAGYEALRPRLHALYGDGARWRRLALHVTALALTSGLAGTASAPFGAYHFGRIQLYFVLANMVAVPLTALWVMPAGLVALGLLPLGLERLALVPMGWGVGAILWVARTTANWPAATIAVPHMPGWGLALVGLGMACLGLWRGPLRLSGVTLIAAGLISPIMVRPPDLLVSNDARMVGVRTVAGVFVARETGASKFTRDAWVQYWADGPPMPFPRGVGAAADEAILCTTEACRLRPQPNAATALLLRGDASASSDCDTVAVVLAIGRAKPDCPGVAITIDRLELRRRGAAAIWLRPDGAEVITDRDWRGVRPWTPSVQGGQPPPLDLPLAPAGA